jgi:two-component sensor histidine kinase
VNINYDADAIQLPSDAFMALALIANESRTNAGKYGLNCRNARQRAIDERERIILLYAEDEGPGFDLPSVQ